MAGRSICGKASPANSPRIASRCRRRYCIVPDDQPGCPDYNIAWAPAEGLRAKCVTSSAPARGCNPFARSDSRLLSGSVALESPTERRSCATRSLMRSTKAILRDNAATSTTGARAICLLISASPARRAREGAMMRHQHRDQKCRWSMVVMLPPYCSFDVTDSASIKRSGRRVARIRAGGSRRAQALSASLSRPSPSGTASARLRSRTGQQDGIRPELRSGYDDSGTVDGGGGRKRAG